MEEPSTYHKSESLVYANHVCASNVAEKTGAPALLCQLKPSAGLTFHVGILLYLSVHHAIVFHGLPHFFLNCHFLMTL